MSWKRRQKFLIHLYPRAAGLTEQERRHVLYEVSGCKSAAAQGLTQHHFEQAMARYEALLDYRIQEGFLPGIPDFARKWISNLHYWRHRLPDRGAMNSRQRHLIFRLWDELLPLLPPEDRNPEYLRGIACKATARDITDLFELRRWQAALLIEALKDRLSYALKHRAEAITSAQQDTGPPSCES